MKKDILFLVNFDFVLCQAAENSTLQSPPSIVQIFACNKSIIKNNMEQPLEDVTPVPFSVEKLQELMIHHGPILRYAPMGINS
jgi:hypothetical protein